MIIPRELLERILAEMTEEEQNTKKIRFWISGGKYAILRMKDMRKEHG